MEDILVFEFSDGFIKIAELNTQDKSLHIRHLVSLSSEGIKNTSIVDPKTVAEAISSFLKSNNITSRKAFALVGPPNSITKIVRLPHNLSDAQIRLNLQTEIDQYRVFSGQDTVFDFRKIEEISEEGFKKTNILFSATTAQLSASYLRTMELAGLDLVGIDVPVLSIIRLLEETDLKADSLEVSLIVSLGLSHLDICVVKGSRPRFLHSVELDIDWDKDRDNLTERIVSTMKLVANFYQARFIQGEEIGRIIVCPLDKKYAGLSRIIAEKFSQIPVKEVSFIDKFVIQDKRIEPQDLQFSFAALLGLMLRYEDKKRGYDLNLLLEQKTARQYHLNKMYLLLVSLVGVFLVVLFFWLVIGLRVIFLRMAIARTESLFKSSPKLEKILVLKEKENIISSQLEEASYLPGAQEKKDYFNNIAKALSLVPGGLWLNDVLLEDKELLLNGESGSERAIFDYVSVLSGSDYFASAELVSSKGQAEGLRFNIKCKLK